MDVFPDAHKPVEILGLMKAPVLARVDDPFVDTLRLMYNLKIGGLPLVDRRFEFAEHFSASDMRGIRIDCFQFFQATTFQFLRVGAGKPKTGKRVTIQPGTSLREVVKTLLDARVHRTYMLDETNHVRGVLTMGDIMNHLFWLSAH